MQVPEFTEAELTAKITAFLDIFYKGQVQLAAEVWTEKNHSIYVKFKELLVYDMDVTRFLLANPSAWMYAARKAAANMLDPEYRERVINVRPTAFPDNIGEYLKVQIRNIRISHLGQLVTVDGVIGQVGETVPLITDAAFQCSRCGSISRVNQEDATVLMKPIECDKDTGGCGKGANQTSFKLLRDPSQLTGDKAFYIDKASLSDFINFQKIDIQERPEEAKGETPQKLIVYCEDDLTGTIAPGARVKLNAIVKTRVREKGQQMLPSTQIYLQAISIETDTTSLELIVTEEEEAQIRCVASNPEVVRLLEESIAPSIGGYRLEKRALAFQLFGGEIKYTKDGQRVRGSIHLFFCGDPGTGKSQLLKYMERLAPRAVYVSGATSNKVGLAGGLKKVTSENSVGAEEWVLTAGALVLAHGTLAIIDELDKMDSDDTKVLHEALEQQEIHIDKIIKARLPCVTSLLAAANPKMGRYRPGDPIAKQINVIPSLLNRFDAIFIICDVPDRKRDERIADMILTNLQYSALEQYKSSGILPPVIPESKDTSEPPLSNEFIRKYVTIAKRITPVLENSAKVAVKDYFVKKRLSNGSDGPIPLGNRQLHAIYRFAEAAAKIRLSRVVTNVDVAKALEIYDHYLDQIMKVNGGILDIDRIENEFDFSQRTRILQVLGTVTTLSGSGGVAFKMDIIDAMRKIGYNEEDIVDTLDRLKQEGRLYEPSEGQYRRIS